MIVETELNMYQAQSKEYKHTVGILDSDIGDLKARYIAEYQQTSGVPTDRALLPPIPQHVLPPLPIKDISREKQS
jgi:hypothetical protein